MDWYERYWGLRDSGQASELSHGAGLTPRHLRHAAPADGGMYAAKSPPMGPDRDTPWRSHPPARQLRA